MKKFIKNINSTKELKRYFSSTFLNVKGLSAPPYVFYSRQPNTSAITLSDMIFQLHYLKARSFYNIINPSTSSASCDSERHLLLRKSNKCRDYLTLLFMIFVSLFTLHLCSGSHLTLL